MRNILSIIILGGIVQACSSSSVMNEEQNDYCQYVNTLIGTAENGHTYPGATSPFGLIQASPKTGNDGWKYCSGFNLSDDSIIGFAQTHLSGTGGPGLGDILLLPFSHDKNSFPYKTKYEKESQVATAGYYSVVLPDENIQAEMTTTQRTAFYRFIYKASDEPRQLLLDLQNGIAGWGKNVNQLVLSATMQTPNAYTITGYNDIEAWVHRRCFYAIEFDKPFQTKKSLPNQPDQKAERLVLSFDADTLLVKVGLSTVSVEGALQSLKKENSQWNFDNVRNENQAEWNKQLSVIDIDGTDDEKVNFYTSLYHAFIQPNNLADTDGQYRGADDSIAHSISGNYYSTFSLWDTYRALHPLYTLIMPSRVGDMVQSMVEHYQRVGILPIWTLWGKENYCMIGNHSIPVIVDAYLKGFKGFDPEKAYEAIRATLTTSHLNSDWETYDKYGYYPFDIVKVESVSRTLESTFDDYCAALMAKSLGKEADYKMFLKRSEYWKNLLDPSTHLMRGKDSKGKWRTPFKSLQLSHATTSGGDYTEGNAWQYTWHVQHDVNGLVQLMGGANVFAEKLDTLFFLNSKEKNTGFTQDVTGLIGQYAHGNEPSHHVVYLYNYAGQPWKTQQLVREVFDRFYLPKPDGLCGNDDCGQMSSWYIFSSMGFYPVNPVSQEYVLGAPQIPKAVIHVSPSKTFVIEARNLSKENKYVESVLLNGVPLKSFVLKHSNILNGGHLVFNMTSIPNNSEKK